MKTETTISIPETQNLATLRAAAAKCHGCELYRRATQTVFGEGRQHARLMLVGETPGDREDLEGRPFVGPAGRLLDEICREAGIDRKAAYVTNAVKHFKWEERGKKRLHAKPTAREITACRPWLQAEILAVSPDLIVCLGATAAQSLLGRDFRITRQHGEILDSKSAYSIMATFHPSAVLRSPDAKSRASLRQELVHDLTIAVRWLERARG